MWYSRHTHALSVMKFLPGGFRSKIILLRGGLFSPLLNKLSLVKCCTGQVGAGMEKHALSSASHQYPAVQSLSPPRQYLYSGESLGSRCSQSSGPQLLYRPDFLTQSHR